MASTAEKGLLAQRRVLIVEDEYFLAEDVSEALQRMGAQVLGPVPTVEGALAVLADEPVDVAVLDINLRGKAVFPVVDLLRKQGVPFVFASGYGEDAIPPSMRDIPRWEKPYRAEDLAEVLPTLVNKS